MASRAEVHALYQQAVQCVEAEIDFVDEIFAKLRRRKARHLREDFCGTASAACEWVGAAGRTGRWPSTSTPRSWRGDAGTTSSRWGDRRGGSSWSTPTCWRWDRPGMDAVLAMNFSYWVLHTRAALRGYFEKVRDALAADGVFFLDAYGGYDAFREMKETTENEGFTYVWDQAWYDPITGRSRCRIHFRFPDGSGIEDAFVYEWRLWTLPEIREVLEEAGFRDVTVYWQGTDRRTGEGNGVFTPAEHGEADAGWITYVTALK